MEIASWPTAFRYLGLDLGFGTYIIENCSQYQRQIVLALRMEMFPLEEYLHRNASKQLCRTFDCCKLSGMVYEGCSYILKKIGSSQNNSTFPQSSIYPSPYITTHYPSSQTFPQSPSIHPSVQNIRPPYPLFLNATLVDRYGICHSSQNHRCGPSASSSRKSYLVTRCATAILMTRAPCQRPGLGNNQSHRSA